MAADVGFECKGCGACCKTGFPPFTPTQLEQLPAALALDVIAVRDKGWTPYPNHDCSWLTEAKTCRHYDHRPPPCVTFPVGGPECLAYRREAGLAQEVVEGGA